MRGVGILDGRGERGEEGLDGFDIEDRGGGQRGDFNVSGFQSGREGAGRVLRVGGGGVGYGFAGYVVEVSEAAKNGG